MTRVAFSVRLRRCLPIAFAILVLAAQSAVASDAQRVAVPDRQAGGPIQQLRIYEIFDDTREAFHARFRDHAMPLMEGYGFDIVAMWESRQGGRLEFVYLLEWPDEEAMRSGWERFMADEGWAAIKRETAQAHGQFVGDIQERTLRPVGYSPRHAFDD